MDRCRGDVENEEEVKRDARVNSQQREKCDDNKLTVDYMNEKSDSVLNSYGI